MLTNTHISNFLHNIIRYQFEVSNSLGSVEGSVVLEVQEGEGEGGNNKELKFDSNPVAQKEFGEYVASLHSCNNSTFILQYQVQLAKWLYLQNITIIDKFLSYYM